VNPETKNLGWVGCCQGNGRYILNGGVAMRSEETSEYRTQSVIKKWFNQQRTANYGQPTPGFLITVEPLRTARLDRFMQEHRDLDRAITLLREAGTLDASLITRLKKRKLQIKDEIALIERSV